MTRKTPGIKLFPIQILTIVSPNLNSLLSPTAMEKALNKIPPMPSTKFYSTFLMFLESEAQPISGSFLVLAPQPKTQNSPPSRPLPEPPKKQKPVARPETTYYATPVFTPTEENSSFVAEPSEIKPATEPSPYVFWRISIFNKKSIVTRKKPNYT